MDSLTQYKSSVQSRLDNADLLVSKLVHENSLLSQKVDNKQQEIDTLKQQLEASFTDEARLPGKKAGLDCRGNRHCSGSVRASLWRAGPQILRGRGRTMV